MVRGPAEERIVIILCLLSFLALTPFAIMRFVLGDYTIAAVDFFGVIAVLLIVTYILRTGKTKLPGLILSVVSLSGVILITKIQGNGDVSFLYPTILWTFFLVTPRVALVLALVVLAIITPSIHQHSDSFAFSKFVFSMLGCMLFAYTFSTLRNRQRDELILLSSKDGLTGAGNRRALDEKLAQSIIAYGRNKTDICLLILDLDNFKIINDKLGHGMGDHILRSITEIIQVRIRATDNLYRYGGDEFVILTTGADLLTAMSLAEDIRARVENDGMIHDSKVSLSLGVAQYLEGQSVKQWLEAADTALLKAKREGRNKVFAAVV